MQITVDPVGPNQTAVTFGEVELFFSYKTCVAAYAPKLGWLRDAHKYSKTTSRHVNKWMDGVIGRELSTETFQQVITQAIESEPARQIEEAKERVRRASSSDGAE